MTALCGGELRAEMCELRKMFEVPSGDGIPQPRQHAAAEMLNSSDMVHNEDVTFLEDHPH